MLGIFKGRSKDKSLTENKEAVKITEKRCTLKKSKSQEKSEKHDKMNDFAKEKKKDDKFSRFSFKRSKSLEKKKPKEHCQRQSLFSVSSTPSLLDDKEEELKEVQNGGFITDDTDRDDESESHSLYTVSSSDITSTGADTSESVATSVNQTTKNSSSSSLLHYQPSNNICDIPKSSVSLNTPLNLVSEKYLRNCQTYPRKVPIYQRSIEPPTDSAVITSLTTGSQSALSISPHAFRKADSQSSISESSYKICSASAGDGSASMVSTPSSSTSSLSSISGRPISPSGRRTPPGPKLGTGGRIPSSPTTIRKTTRSNIKTNSTLFGRKSGQLTSPVGTNSPVFNNEQIHLSSTSLDQIEKDKSQSGQLIDTSNGYTDRSSNLPNPQSPELNGDISHQDNLNSPPQSPSSGIGRPRLSVSSMQSLESIPENENDWSSDANDKNISSLRKTLSFKKVTSKPKIGELKEQCSKLYQEENTNCTLQDNFLSSFSPSLSKTSTPALHYESEMLSNTFPVLTKKPPLILKKTKEFGRPSYLKDVKDRPKLKLTITEGFHSEYGDQNDLSSSTCPYFNAKTSNPEMKMPIIEKNSLCLSQNEGFEMEDTKKGILKEEPGTRVRFRIPVTSNLKYHEKAIRRAISLEIIPTSNTNCSSQDDIYPHSSLSVSCITQKRRSISIPKIIPTGEETDVKQEDPITLEELKRQAEQLTSCTLKTMEYSPSMDNKSHERELNESFEVFKTSPGCNLREEGPDSAGFLNSKSTVTELHLPSEGEIGKAPAKAVIQDPILEKGDRRNRKTTQSNQMAEARIEDKQRLDTAKNPITLSMRIPSQNDLTNKSSTDHEQKRIMENKRETEEEILKTIYLDTKLISFDHSNTTDEMRNVSETEPTPQITNYEEGNQMQNESLNTTLSQNICQRAIREMEDGEIVGNDKYYVNGNKWLNLEERKVQVEENQASEAHFEEAVETRFKKELAEQEEKYQHQIDELTLKLAEKQQEVVDLVEELAEAKQKPTTSSRETDLQLEIEDMKKHVKLKENTTESYRVELQYVKNENDIAKLKIQRLEDDLKRSKDLVSSLQEQTETRARESSRLKDTEDKFKKLEEDLRKSESLRKDLQSSLNEIEAEREEELKIVQDALDEAAQEREELIMTFEKELKHLNSTNTAREQQMMEDFEWKLREKEKDHKKKLEEKERQLEGRLNAVRSVVESEMADSLTKIAEERRIADEKLNEVSHLRSYEAEAIQLRGVTHEFQKALRSSAREIENMKIREKLLEEEIRSLKIGSQSRQNTLHRVKCHNDEEEMRQRLEKLKNEINAKWEDKLRSECSRLKKELDDLHSEEKHLAVESMKVQKEQEMQTLKKSLERSQEEMTKEISTLKDTLTEKDAYYHKELENQRTIADRDIWDLRMKLQRLTESSFDKQQQLEEKYREDMERVRVDHEDRVRSLETRLAAHDAQVGVDLMGQLEKDHKEQMQHLQEQHKLSMERLREELELDKIQAVEEARVIFTKQHEGVAAELKDQIKEYMTSVAQFREEVESLRQTVSRRDDIVRSLRAELEKCQEARKLGESCSQSGSPPFSPTLSSSQYSIASSSDSQGSQSSRTSQDRFYFPENTGVLENTEDSQRVSNTGILGKMFGGGWFTPAKGKESGRRGTNSLSTKKPYGS